MAYVIGIPLMALLAVLQSSILSYLRFLDGRPDLVMLTVVAWGLARRTRESLVWAMTGGLFLDLLSGMPLGTNALALTAVAYLVSLLEGRFWEAHLLMPSAVMLIASFLYHLANLGAYALSGSSFDVSMAFTRVILPSAFLNLLLAIPIAQLARSIVQSVYPPEVSI
jgi:rod shape-determining protein MreD